jgi:cytochrome c oxidase cbb3-type subunit 3
VFHLFPVLPLPIEEYRLEVAAADESKARFLATRPQDAIDPDKLEFNNDPANVAKGKALFANVSCASCHRADGGGNSIGPNLTDNYWLHGGDVKNVFLTIQNGVVEKGMPAWGKSLSPGEVRDLSFFILSLQGSNPVDAKAPQGDLFDPPVARNDSLSVSLKQ